MSKNYGIVRMEKVKASSGGSIVARAKHNLRLNENTKIKFNDESTPENISLGEKTPEDILKKCHEIWATSSDKLRSDAVGLVEILVTTTANAIQKEKEKDFFKASLLEIKKMYGPENVISCQIHYDETTPHMHVFVVPMDKKKVIKKKLTKEELE